MFLLQISLLIGFVYIRGRVSMQHIIPTYLLAYSFEVVYGRTSPIVARYIRDDTSNPNVAESLCRQGETLALLKSNLQAAEECMKRDADKGRKMQAFRLEIGCMFETSLQAALYSPPVPYQTQSKVIWAI